ncbi:MAG: hypothetical protein QOE70_2754 [Chthoniobacter sp.]|nr:hypothetical protein [Chthoniobacter sp.]
MAEKTKDLYICSDCQRTEEAWNEANTKGEASNIDSIWSVAGPRRLHHFTSRERLSQTPGIA